VTSDTLSLEALMPIISLLLLITFNVFAQNITVTVDLKNSNIDDVDLVDNKGRIIPGSGSSKVKFKVAKNGLRNQQ
jgi:hypothetical protein